MGRKIHPVNPQASNRTGLAAIARTFKAKALSGALGALHGTGLLNKYLSRRLRSKVLVLMYHRVLETDQMRSSSSHPGIIVSAATFEMHVCFLQQNFKILSLEDFLEHINNRVPFEDRSCLITFDDGWRDNYTHAFPILKKYVAPAVVFLTTGFIGTERVFWQERFADVVSRIGNPSHENIEAVLADFPELRDKLRQLFLSGPEPHSGQISTLSGQVKNFPQARIETLLARLNSLAGAPAKSAFGDREFLSWDEIREMAAGGIEFGSHGVNHAILTVDDDLAAAEIAASKAEIEERLGRHVSAFSYPNGNYSEKVVELVKKSGYQAAFGTSAGYAAHDCDPFRIQRINVHDSATCSLPLFLGRIAGLC